MLEVVKSKSMLVVIILILGVAYLSTSSTIYLEDSKEENLIVMAKP